MERDDDSKKNHPAPGAFTGESRRSLPYAFQLLTLSTPGPCGGALRFDIVAAQWNRFALMTVDLTMTAFKSGDLVMLKSGGPTMTVDTVNTDIFDDDKITGILCVWFMGEKLQRVRFDPGAIVPAPLEKLPRTEEVPSQEVTGDYGTVLEEMVDAMNLPAEAARPASRAARKRPKSARAFKSGIESASTVVTSAGSSTVG